MINSINLSIKIGATVMQYDNSSLEMHRISHIICAPVGMLFNAFRDRQHPEYYSY